MMARKSLRYIWVYAGEGKDRDCIGRLSFTRSEYAALLAGGSSVDLGKEMMAAMDHDRPIIGSLCHAIDYVKATQENWTRNKPEWVDPGVKIYPREARIPVGIPMAKPPRDTGCEEAREQNEELKRMFGVK